jgi:hypothetical protein
MIHVDLPFVPIVETNGRSPKTTPDAISETAATVRPNLLGLRRLGENIVTWGDEVYWA